MSRTKNEIILEMILEEGFCFTNSCSKHYMRISDQSGNSSRKSDEESAIDARKYNTHAHHQRPKKSAYNYSPFEDASEYANIPA